MATVATLAGVLLFSTPGDVESDTIKAAVGTGNVQITRKAQSGGFLEFEVIAGNQGIIQLGGTPTSGDTVAYTLNGHQVIYTLGGGDTTLALVATHVAAALNGDGTFAAEASAVAVGTTVVITTLESGVENQYPQSVATTGGHTTAVLAPNNATVQPTDPFAGLTSGAACTVTITQ